MRYRLRIVCFIAFVFAMGTTALHAQDRLVLGFGGKTGGLQPILSTRILTEAYDRIGIEVEARLFPGLRSLSTANQGAIDGELFRGELDSDAFPNLIRVPVPILFGELVVFTKDVEFEVTGWDCLRPYTIGILVEMKEGIEEGTRGMRVEAVKDIEQLFMKLAAGRNDIVIPPRDIGMDALASMIGKHHEGASPQALQKISTLEPPLKQSFLHHCLHNRHEELVPKITAVLQEMTDEGRIQSITEEVEAEFYNQ